MNVYMNKATAGNAEEQARRRHAIAFGPTERVRTSALTDAQTRIINDAISNRLAALIPARETIADKFHAALVDEFNTDIKALMLAWDKHDIIEHLVQDALSIYNGIRRKSDNDRETRAALHKYVDEHADALDKRIASIIDDAGTNAFAGDRELVEQYFVLFAESGAAFVTRSLRGQFDTITKTLFSYSKATSVSDADKWLFYFTLGKGDLPPLPASTQMQELATTIAQRANKITLNGFSGAMFETLRGTIKTNLYDAVDGGAGAEEIARKIGKDLRDKFGGSLPADTQNRLMLWARTEGCTMQNDALMKRGADCGMDGKIWQTVGDARVRPAHSLNESAGVIPAGTPFPDGSYDGGSGSVSPYNCRCAVGPALLPWKKGKKTKPTTTTSTPPSNADAKKPKPTKVPKKPKPKKPVSTVTKPEPTPVVDAADAVQVPESLGKLVDEVAAMKPPPLIAEPVQTPPRINVTPPEPPKPKDLKFDADGNVIGFNADGQQISFPGKFENLYNEDGVLVPNPQYTNPQYSIYAPNQKTPGMPAPMKITPHVEAKANVLVYDDAALKNAPVYHPTGQPFSPNFAESLGKYQNVYNAEGVLVDNPYIDTTLPNIVKKWAPGQEFPYSAAPEITPNSIWQAKQAGVKVFDEAGHEIYWKYAANFENIYNDAGVLCKNPYFKPNSVDVWYAPNKQYDLSKFKLYDNYGRAISANNIQKFQFAFDDAGVLCKNPVFDSTSKDVWFQPGSKINPALKKPVTIPQPSNVTVQNAGVFDAQGNALAPSILSDSKFVYDAQGNYVQNPYYISKYKGTQWHTAKDSPQWVKDLAESSNAPKIYNAQGAIYKTPEAAWKTAKVFDKYGNVIDNPYYDASAAKTSTPKMKKAPSKSAAIPTKSAPRVSGSFDLAIDDNVLKTYATVKDGSYVANGSNDAYYLWDDVRKKAYADIKKYVDAGYATQKEFDAYVKAVNQYKGSLYQPINAILRNDAAKKKLYKYNLDEAQKAIDAMERFSRVARVTDNVTLYRGIDSDAGRKLFDELPNAVGTVKMDSAFGSSSFDVTEAYKFAGDRSIVYEIRTPNGFNFMVGTDYEREMILPPGFALRIDDASKVIERYGSKMRIVKCTLISS